MIVLTGGTVYGVPNTTATEHVCMPKKLDVIITAERILALMEPSKTDSFVNFMKEQNLQILPISVQDQLVIPGLIDPHIHAIGGGGEQGMLRIEIWLLIHNLLVFIHFGEKCV
jgi:predicted amidohydrolase YtcJ